MNFFHLAQIICLKNIIQNTRELQRLQKCLFL